MAKPALAWTEGLSPRGLYFEGFVDDADALLEQHKADTVTTYGTRRSRGKSSKKLQQELATDCSEDDKENASMDSSEEDTENTSKVIT